MIQVNYYLSEEQHTELLKVVANSGKSLSALTSEAVCKVHGIPNRGEPITKPNGVEVIITVVDHRAKPKMVQISETIKNKVFDISNAPYATIIGEKLNQLALNLTVRIRTKKWGAVKK